MLSYRGKITAYDYYTTLEKLTDNIGGKRFSPLQPGVSGPKFKSCYSAFLRMARQWRHLKELKQGGRGNDGVRRVTDTRVGELGIRCIACLCPGVNLPEDWEKSPEEHQFLYVIFMAINTCFRLKNRQISSWTVDPPLGDGWSYFVESEAYLFPSRCVLALDHVNTKSSSGYRATGVGMCTCARHEVVMRNGVGDLQRGERYSNMDYIFTSTLRHFSDLLHLLISYDIACQWSKKLLERLKTLPPLVRLRGILKILAFVIPKLHILGHIVKCQRSFNLSYTRGAGQSDGEGIERIWSGSGLLGTSTREMGPGSRQNTCEDYWHHWNWRKVIGLGRYIPSILL
ncbi:hypothetical protein EV360DRAFT_97078 [Lentinula raphanica]|nr:hypothetical protein EV360DRAFT_97078 [Lentinula raphanica]